MHALHGRMTGNYIDTFHNKTSSTIENESEKHYMKLITCYYLTLFLSLIIITDYIQRNTVSFWLMRDNS
jgi:hypothetical protein